MKICPTRMESLRLGMRMVDSSWERYGSVGETTRESGDDI
jgi:hypothetical protein